MKRMTIPILVAALAAAVVSFNACSKTDIEASKVLVVISQGVTGIPGQGTYNLVAGDSLHYSFSLLPGFSTLNVIWDGNTIAASGAVTPTPGEHTLQAYADGNVQRGLTVYVGEGVNGTPAAGTFNYPQGTTVNYSYTAQDGYYNLMVLVDGLAVENSGTIVMDRNHQIDVATLAGKKLRDSWLLAEAYSDGSAFTVDVNFSGSYASGTVSDSQGGSGTYTFIGATVAFTLVFPNVTYEYSGGFTDDDTMGGTCKRYQSAATVVTGNWIAKRKSAITATALSRTGKGEWRAPANP